MTKKEDKLVEAVQEIEYQKQASGAFVDGIISLFIFHLIFGIIAIVRANIALKSKNEEVVKKAKTGRTLGIIGVVYPLVLWVLLFGVTSCVTISQEATRSRSGYSSSSVYGR